MVSPPTAPAQPDQVADQAEHAGRGAATRPGLAPVDSGRPRPWDPDSGLAPTDDQLDAMIDTEPAAPCPDQRHRTPRWWENATDEQMDAFRRAEEASINAADIATYGTTWKEHNRRRGQLARRYRLAVAAVLLVLAASCVLVTSSQRGMLRGMTRRGPPQLRLLPPESASIGTSMGAPACARTVTS